MNAGGAVDLVGAWYELAATLMRGRPVDPESGWPVLTTREAFEVASTWGRLLARLGDAVEPIAWRWLDDSRAALSESRGPDELLPSSSDLWEAGAALLARLATRNAEPPISVRFDDKGRLLVANVNDPSDLEYALRRFFIAQGRTERKRKKSRDDRTYVEVTVGDAIQLLAIWDKYAATAKPVPMAEGGMWRDPRVPWREFAAKARELIKDKKPDELYPVDEVEELWIQMRRLGRDLSVLKDGQPQRGWSDFVDSVKDTIKGYAGAVGDAAGAVGGAVGDAAGAVARGAGGFVKPVAIGLGAIAGVALLATMLRK